MVLKPTESIEHGGGFRIEYDGGGADILLEWIRQGALPSHGRRLEQFHVLPTSHVADHLGDTVQLTATAEFSDAMRHQCDKVDRVCCGGSVRLSKLIQKRHRRDCCGAGRHVVIARYLDRVVPLQMIVPLSDKAVDLSAAPRQNFIDDEVLQLLSTFASPFLRRRMTPLFCGGQLWTLPVDCPRSIPFASSLMIQILRSEQLVDGLLESREFVEYWTLKLAKLLRVRSQPQDKQGAWAYHEWLKARNLPMPYPMTKLPASC